MKIWSMSGTGWSGGGKIALRVPQPAAMGISQIPDLKETANGLPEWECADILPGAARSRLPKMWIDEGADIVE